MMRTSGTQDHLRALSNTDIDHEMGNDTAALGVESSTLTPIINTFSVKEKYSMVDNRSQHDIGDPITDCRDMSSSAWLYFPHVELLFLLFAFEGFLAAQVYGAYQSECLPAQIVAVVVLVRMVLIHDWRLGLTRNLTSNTWILDYFQ